MTTLPAIITPTMPIRRSEILPYLLCCVRDVGQRGYYGLWCDFGGTGDEQGIGKRDMITDRNPDLDFTA